MDISCSIEKLDYIHRVHFVYTYIMRKVDNIVLIYYSIKHSPLQLYEY